MNALKLSTLLILLSLIQTGLGGPLDTWGWRPPLPTGNALWSIAYGDGQFVAVGDLGTIVTSPDGLNWTLRPSGTTNALLAVAYGNHRFVALGLDFSEIAISVVSTNGVDWVPHELSVSNSAVVSLAFGDGQFVAVGAGDTIISSADGFEWAGRKSGTGTDFNGIGYGNGEFVAVGPTRFLTSGDGTNWLQRQPGTAPNSYFFSAVAYGGGQFVAVGGDAAGGRVGVAETSTDGVTWVLHYTGATNWLNLVAYGSGRFVAADSLGGILTSADGTNWIIAQVSSSLWNQWSAVAFGSGKFVAVGGSLATSVDGANWAVRQSVWMGGYGTAWELAYDRGRFITVLGYSEGKQWLISSPDGGGWVFDDPWQAPYGPMDITHGNGVFAAGQLWPGGGGGTLLTSTNGTDWFQQQSVILENPFNSIAFGNGHFEAVQSDGTLLTSADAVHWTSAYEDPVYMLRAITRGNGQFVVVGDWGTILSSSDGTNWVRRQSGTTNSIVAVAYGGGEFAAAGENGTILTSTDGANWVERQTGTTNWLTGIAFGDGRFVAVGDYGTVLQSGSIITLTIGLNSTAGQLALSVTGPTEGNYTIQSSTDLISWRNLTNVTITESISVILDSLPAASDHVFYRAYSQ
jgi:hypothetical protein